MTNIDRVRPQSKRKMLSAYTFSTRYLAEANAAYERGERSKAGKLYAKSQYWLDRYNQLYERRGPEAIGVVADRVLSGAQRMAALRKILDGFDERSQKVLIMGWRGDGHIANDQCEWLIKEYGLQNV